MRHFYPLGFAQLFQFGLVALVAVGLVVGLTRRAAGRTWPLPLSLIIFLVPLGVADWWLNRGLGNPAIRGVEGMDNDWIGVSLHYDLMIVVALISLVCVGLAARKRRHSEGGRPRQFLSATVEN